MPRWLAPLVVLAAALPARGQESSGWIDLLATAGPELKKPSPWSFDPGTGVLTSRGDEAGHEWLRRDRELTDFVFHVEWRFVPVAGKSGYNSGVFAHNSADGRIWHQAQTGGGSGGFLFGDTPVDGMLKRVNLSKQVTGPPVKPAGEWNTYEITCRGPQMALRVNGTDTCTWRDLAVPSGFVGLEAEGWRIEFRTLKVKVLPRDLVATGR